ncbi:MAG TPA: FAD:protein FMN transferase, partial [Isosphaeraceae bacterium]|nr:FAD:protein FMN transferase [Isosphaeraceae bacterium]
MKPPRSSVNRRAWLRRLGPTTGSGATLADPLAERARLQSTDLLKASRPAMGSFFEVRLPANLPAALDLADRALDVVEALEGQMTIYRDDSEVSRLNARAHEGPVEVEAGLFGLIERALEIGRRTGGAYDVASGSLSKAWGFIRGPRRVPEPAVLEEARSRSGASLVSLDRDRKSVAFARPGVTLNFGSIGKGYAIDQAVEVIRTHWWPTPALIHGGQSSLYALGSPPWKFGGRWDVALQNPFEPSQPLGMIYLRNRGLGTSGAAFQQFESGGRLYGHIIDPRTGEPPERGPASVTVLAPSAADADALST